MNVEAAKRQSKRITKEWFLLNNIPLHNQPDVYTESSLAVVVAMNVIVELRIFNAVSFYLSHFIQRVTDSSLI